jgi:tetratricopeptide (TPR) repeat protein
MRSLSIILTAHNCAGVLPRTLQSAQEAMDFITLQPGLEDIPTEVIAVDDGSSDQTARIITDFIADKAAWKLIRRDRSSSPSCARNTGVSQAQSDLLSFLDGDDLFLPSHLAECCQALADDDIDFVKTGVQLADPVHPEWKPRIKYSIVINLCLRRRCHELIGGFPDYHLFQRVDGRFDPETDIFFKIEDMFYNLLLHELCRGKTIERETVEYCRHPGNSYDRQYAKFAQPFAAHQPPTDPEERLRLRLAEVLIQDKIERLRGPVQSALRGSSAVRGSPDPAYRPKASFSPLETFGQDVGGVGRPPPSAPSPAPSAPSVRILQADRFDDCMRQGIELAQNGRLDEAIPRLQEAVRLQPDSAQALYNLAIALIQKGQPAEGEACLREALRQSPDYAAAHYALASLRVGQGQREQALPSFQRALELKPDYWEAYNNFGLAVTELKRPDEAIVLLRQAVRLRPEAAESHNNLGLAYADLGRFAEAEACYQEALRINPRYHEAHVNLGSVYKEQGRLDEAQTAYQLALWLEPKSVAAHWNRSLAWLAAGDFERGWREYEWRWQRKETPARQLPGPRWDGSPLDGRTILVYMEQGLGDMLQFIRYAPLVKECGSTVVVECPSILVNLLSLCPGIDQLVPEGAPLPEFQIHAPLLSLPGLLGTTLATVPAQVPYLFPEPKLIEHWRVELERYPGFRIGITWQGNTRHAWDRHRSFPLKQFAPLARAPGIQLISLQKGAGTEQLAEVKGRFPVRELAGELDASSGAFVDTAAIMKSLDLVITPDTATAHLAGALGVSVWLVLSAMPDWRWMWRREDSPWYPTMHLFRQDGLDDWRPVFERMAGEIAVMLDNSGQHKGRIVEPPDAVSELASIVTRELRPAKVAVGGNGLR